VSRIARMMDRLKRWLRSREGRIVLVGAIAGTMVTTTAFAQDPHAQPVVQDPHGGPVAPPHGQTPPGVAAPQGATDPHATGGPHGPGAAHAPGAGSAEHGGAHAVHHPEPFNFADINRYQLEKDKAAKGEKDAHGNPIVPVTPYAYLLINAAILFFIYYRAGKKPISEGLQARHDAVAKELQEASRIKAEAEAQAAEYASKLERLEDELEQIKADTIKAGEADRARIIREAEEKAERMRKDAQFLLDQELKQLRNDMVVFTAEAAVAAAESVLRAKVTSSDHDRLADEFLNDVSKPVGGVS
jgi:F-type H+-transporting ATPase subunit b